MIKKITFGLIISFITFWFIGAYIVKGKVTSFVDKLSDDNLQITYEDSSIGGFPLSWKVKLSNPKLTKTTAVSSIDYQLTAADFVIPYTLNGFTVNFGNTLNVTRTMDAEVTEYKLTADKSVIAYIDTSKRLYDIDVNDFKFTEIIQKVSLGMSKIEGAHSDKIIFTLKDFKFNLDKKSNINAEDINIFCNGEFESDDGLLAFNKTKFDSNLSYVISNTSSEEREFDKMFKINRLFANFDDSFVDVKGGMAFKHKRLPNGEFNLEIKNYNEIVDIVVPEGFILSGEYIKKVIAKAAFDGTNIIHPSDIVNFKMAFSDKGISIGKLKLLETGN